MDNAIEDRLDRPASPRKDNVVEHVRDGVPFRGSSRRLVASRQEAPHRGQRRLGILADNHA